MPDISQENQESSNKKGVFDFFIEIVAWLQIMVSPFLIGLVIGCFIYFGNQTEGNLIMGIVIAGIGLVIGIVWATKIWRKRGTNHFVSQIMATPDLSTKDERPK